MDTKTKRTIVFVLGVAVILTVIGTISYAFFSPLGESTPEQATISTGTARATFRDGDTGITGELSFGESLTKSFTIENSGTVAVNVKMYFKDLINTYGVGSLTYTLSQSETEDGSYTEIVSKTNVPRSVRPVSEILANSLTIPAGRTYYYNLAITLNNLPDVNQDADITAKFSTTFNIQDMSYKDPSPSEKTLVALGQRSNGIKTNFDDPAITDEGIFEMEDDYGTSYYYRGAVENNYVKYGVNKDGQEMWWRIIRINGDGSVRMVYDGTQGYANGAANNDRFIKTDQPYNSLHDDAKYVGWMYGPANEVEGTTTPSTSKEEAQSNVADSDIKKVIDAWYKENILDTGYGANVNDAIFCNDRSIPGTDITGWIDDTGLGYGSNYTAYGVAGRYLTGNNGTSLSAKTEIQPIFTCSEKNDAFTVSDTSKGNGALTYPVGLITADEIVSAGSGKYATQNKKYYLYKSENYVQWSISPVHLYYGGANVMDVYTPGHLAANGVSRIIGAAAPVINISKEYARNLIGTGTISDPYRA